MSDLSLSLSIYIYFKSACIFCFVFFLITGQMSVAWWELKNNKTESIVIIFSEILGLWSFCFVYFLFLFIWSLLLFYFIYVYENIYIYIYIYIWAGLFFYYSQNAAKDRNRWHMIVRKSSAASTIHPTKGYDTHIYISSTSSSSFLQDRVNLLSLSLSLSLSLTTRLYQSSLQVGPLDRIRCQHRENEFKSLLTSPIFACLCVEI